MLLVFVAAGGVFASLNAGADYAQDAEFSLPRFLFHFFFFGLCMSLLSGYNLRKQAKQNQNPNSLQQ